LYIRSFVDLQGSIGQWISLIRSSLLDQALSRRFPSSFRPPTVESTTFGLPQGQPIVATVGHPFCCKFLSESSQFPSREMPRKKKKLNSKMKTLGFSFSLYLKIMIAAPIRMSRNGGKVAKNPSKARALKSSFENG
jgi:hypothetical protein